MNKQRMIVDLQDLIQVPEGQTWPNQFEGKHHRFVPTINGSNSQIFLNVNRDFLSFNTEVSEYIADYEIELQNILKDKNTTENQNTLQVPS